MIRIDSPKKIGNLNSNYRSIFIIVAFTIISITSSAKNNLIDTVKIYTNIKEAIKEPENVEILTISELIDTIPKEITLFKNLKELNLLNTRLKIFPNEVFELSNLEKIHVNALINAFYVIPDKFNQLPNLTDFSIINIHTTRDTLFPQSFYQLTKLKKLEVWAPSFPQRELNLLSSSFDLHTLNLSGSLLGIIPESCSKFKNLEILILHNCNIHYEKNEDNSIKVFGIEGLKMLKTLDLSGNRFIQFPVEILSLSLLEELNLEKNEINKIPQNISTLKNLKYLYLGCNSFEYFPKELYTLKNLKELSFNGIGISGIKDMKVMLEMPLGISNLENLEKLDISNYSFLQHLPKDIIKLKKLDYLNISYNPSLLSLNEINEISSLKYINLMYINDLSIKFNFSFTNDIKTIVIDKTISKKYSDNLKQKCNNCELQIKSDSNDEWNKGYDCTEIARNRFNISR